MTTNRPYDTVLVYIEVMKNPKKKVLTRPHSILLSFELMSMQTEAIVAQLVSWKACAISSDLFATMVVAHVLLVLDFC